MDFLAAVHDMKSALVTADLGADANSDELGSCESAEDSRWGDVAILTVEEGHA